MSLTEIGCEFFQGSSGFHNSPGKLDSSGFSICVGGGAEVFTHPDCPLSGGEWDKLFARAHV
jgi:hypothetical protein